MGQTMTIVCQLSSKHDQFFRASKAYNHLQFTVHPEIEEDGVNSVIMSDQTGDP